MICMLLWKLSQVVVERTPEQRPLLAPIVAHQVSNVSSFAVLPSGSGQRKMGTENGQGNKRWAQNLKIGNSTLRRRPS
jgi:hypothetical protein